MGKESEKFITGLTFSFFGFTMGLIGCTFFGFGSLVMNRFRNNADAAAVAGTGHGTS